MASFSFSTGGVLTWVWIDKCLVGGGGGGDEYILVWIVCVCVWREVATATGLSVCILYNNYVAFSFSDPSLKTLCLLKVIEHNLDIKLLPHDLR